MALKPRASNRSSSVSHGWQVSRSVTVGLLAGGAQRTAATIRVLQQPLPVAGRRAVRLGGQPAPVQ